MTAAMTASAAPLDRLARLEEFLASPSRSSELTKPSGLARFEVNARLRPAAALAALQPTEAAYDNLVASLRETAALLRSHRLARSRDRLADAA